MKQQKFFVGDKVKRTTNFIREFGAEQGEVYTVDGYTTTGWLKVTDGNQMAVQDADHYTIVERAWQENDGVQPVPDGVEIEYKYEADGDVYRYPANGIRWEKDTGWARKQRLRDVEYWRIADNYEEEQPAEVEELVAINSSYVPFHVVSKNGLVAVDVQKAKQEWTDKHYSSEYVLTQKDIEKGFVKIDPYFVSKMWKIGSKDDSGALWHCFKTIARFGEKNSREREIKALYAQIKRLAEMEGVVLE